MRDFETLVRHDFFNPRTLTGAVIYGIALLTIAWIVARALALTVREALARANGTMIDRTSVMFVTQLAQIGIYILRSRSTRISSRRSARWARRCSPRLTLRAWCPNGGAAKRAEFDLYERAKRRFDDAHIEIPVPSIHVTVTMRDAKSNPVRAEG